MRSKLTDSIDALASTRLPLGSIFLVLVVGAIAAPTVFGQTAAVRDFDKNDYPWLDASDQDISSPSDLPLRPVVTESDPTSTSESLDALTDTGSVKGSSNESQETEFAVLTSSILADSESIEIVLPDQPQQSPIPSVQSCGTDLYEVFEVSTRHKCCGTCNLRLGDDVFKVNRFDDGNCAWSQSDLETALHGKSTADVPSAITILYAHGNWMERNNARNRARIIANFISKTTQRPFRVVMLSWPSTRMRRPIKDIYNHAQCADKEAFYMAYLMRKFQPEQQIGLLGFSLGARIVGGALHLDAGGCLIGRKLVDYGLEDRSTLDPAEFRKYRVTLVAPAIDQSWLSTGNRFGLAMLETDRLVNLYNSRDPVLRRYFLSDLSRRPLAAGFAGFIGLGDLRSSQPLAQQPRVDQFDCRTYLRNTHDEKSYFAKCPCIRNAMLNLTWE